MDLAINEARLVETFLTLCRFNTPSKAEKPVMDWIAAYLRPLGFEVTFDDAGEKVGGNVGNLLAFKKGTIADAPGIFFSSHLDTVEPTPGLEISVEGDVITATSDTILGADDKCGVAPILEAVTALHETGTAHGDIQLILTICEEIGLVGAKMLDPNHIRARYGFVLDSGPPIGTIIVSAPSQNSLRVTITGVPSHAGAAPEKGVSAIVAAANAVSKMRLGRIDEETTANVGTIQGGTARNIVAAEAFLLCEARSRNAEKLRAQTDHMKQVFEEEAAKMGATARVEVDEEYHAYRISPDDAVAQIAATAAQKQGFAVSYRDSGGGADANIFNHYGVPTCVLATGMQKIHTHDEFCTISDMVKDAHWVAEIVQTAATRRN